MAEGWGSIPPPFLTKGMKKVIDLAGIPVELDLAYPAYLPLFDRFSTQNAPRAAISLSRQALDAARRRYEPDAPAAYVEYMELCLRASDALLAFDRAVFHGTAFRWRGKAWIFAALSGTGKTTQYLRWKALWGREVEIINGDKPVLAFHDGPVTVHPSPWNGKEGMGQPLSAPLGGIILLRQSGGNRIRRVGAPEAAGPLLLQFLFSRETPEDVHAVCRLEEQLLRQVPVWLLENRGDEASAILCRDTLMEAQL